MRIASAQSLNTLDHRGVYGKGKFHHYIRALVVCMVQEDHRFFSYLAYRIYYCTHVEEDGFSCLT